MSWLSRQSKHFDATLDRSFPGRDARVWSACYMTDSRISPCTIKPRAVALYLLITLSSVLLGATVAEQGRAGSSSQVDQLTTAFKLLQLQLKQTTETAEHVQSILADLAQQQGDAAPAHGLPAEGVVSKEHDHKPIATYGVVHQGTSIPNKPSYEVLCQFILNTCVLQKLSLYISKVSSAGHWPSDQQAGQTTF